MTDFRVNVIYSDAEARRRNAQFRRELGATEAAANAVRRSLQNAFAAIGVIGAVRGIERLADTYTQVNNRLRVVAQNNNELNRSFERTVQIAIETRSNFRNVAELYARMRINARELGITANGTARFTELLSKAIKISGASATEASGALVQLSQGLSSGRLNGDELRSVLEQLPFVADIIAKEFGVTRGELRGLGADGELVADRIIGAFFRQSESIEESFGKTIPLISEGFQNLFTQLTIFVGELDKLAGATPAIFQGLTLIGNNLDIIAASLGFLVLRLAAVSFAKFVQGVVQATQVQLAYASASQTTGAVLLRSAEADRQRAQFALNAANASRAASAAEISRAQANRTALQSTLALNVSQLEQARIQVQLQQGIAAATGRTIGLTKAMSAQQASLRGVLATKAALRNVTVELAAATVAETAATARATASQAALSAALARATLAARAASAAIATLRGTLAFFGGPVGLAITAVGTALFFMATRASAADKSLETVGRNAGELAAAFEAVGGATNLLARELENLTTAEAIRSQVEAAAVFRKELDQVVSRVESFTSSLSEDVSGATFGPQIENIRNLTDALKSGDVSLSSYRQSLSDISVGIGDTDNFLVGIIDSFLEASRGANDLERSLEVATATVAVLEGNATDAQRELLNLSLATGPISREFQKVDKDAKSALATISEFSKELSSQIKIQEDLTAVRAAFDRGLKEIQDQRRSGDILEIDAIPETEQLRAAFRAATGDITGTTEAAQKAAEAVDSYAAAATRAGLTGRSRAISDATDQYQEIVGLILAAGGNQDQLTAATQAFSTILDSISAQYDEVSQKAARFSEAVSETLSGLDQDISLFSISDQSERDITQTLLRIRSQLSALTTENIDDVMSQVEERVREISRLRQEETRSIAVTSTIDDLNQEIATVRELSSVSSQESALREEQLRVKNSLVQRAGAVTEEETATVERLVAELFRLRQELSDNVSEIKRMSRATAELGRGVDSFLQAGNEAGLSAQELALRRLSDTYEELRTGITSTVSDSGLASAAVDKLTESYEAQKKAIAERFKPRDKTAPGRSKADVVGEIQRGLELDIQRLSITDEAQREFFTQINRIRDRLISAEIPNVQKALSDLEPLIKQVADQTRLDRARQLIRGIRRDTVDAIAVETELLGKSGQQREVQLRLLQLERDLRRDGLSLSDEERLGLENQFTALSELEDQFKRIEEVAQSVASNMTNAIIQFAQTGKLSFKDFANSVISDLIRITVQQSLTGPLVGALSAGLSSLANSAFGGVDSSIVQPRASGGPVTAGMPYIVGEKRPELFVPNSDGFIYPSVGSRKSSQNASNLTINVYVDGDTESRTREAVFQGVQIALRQQKVVAQKTTSSIIERRERIGAGES